MVINSLKCCWYQPSSWSWWCWPAGLSSCWLGESSHQSWFSQLATPPLTLCWTSSSLLFVIVIISCGGHHRKPVGWKVGHTLVIGHWAQNNVVEGHHDKTMLRNKKMWKVHKGIPQNSGDVAILWGLSLKGKRVLKVAIFHPQPIQLFKRTSLFSPKFSPLFIPLFHLSPQTSRLLHGSTRETIIVNLWVCEIYNFLVIE